MGNRTNSNEEKLGTIKILRASNALLNGINSVNIFMQGTEVPVPGTFNYN